MAALQRAVRIRSALEAFQRGDAARPLSDADVGQLGPPTGEIARHLGRAGRGFPGLRGDHRGPSFHASAPVLDAVNGTDDAV